MLGAATLLSNAALFHEGHGHGLNVSFLAVQIHHAPTAVALLDVCVTSGRLRRDAARSPTARPESLVSFP
jgi:hypothetical protein